MIPKDKTSQLLDLIVGAVLTYSAIFHLSNPYFFYESVLNYQLLGAKLSAALAVCITQASFLTGVGLMTGILAKESRYIGMLLLIVFLVAQIWVLFNGLKIGCGCFGQESEAVGTWSVLRIVLLILTSFAAFRLSSSASKVIPSEILGT